MKFARDYRLHRFPLVCHIIGSCHPFVPVIEFPNHVMRTSVNGIAFQMPSISRASLPLYWDFNLPFWVSFLQSRRLCEHKVGFYLLLGTHDTRRVPQEERKNEGVLKKNGTPAPVGILFFLRHPQNSGGRHRLGNMASNDTINRSRSLWGLIKNPNRTKALLVQFIAWLNEWHGYHLLW